MMSFSSLYLIRPISRRSLSRFKDYTSSWTCQLRKSTPSIVNSGMRQNSKKWIIWKVAKSSLKTCQWDTESSWTRSWTACNWWLKTERKLGLSVEQVQENRPSSILSCNLLKSVRDRSYSMTFRWTKSLLRTLERPSLSLTKNPSFSTPLSVKTWTCSIIFPMSNWRKWWRNATSLI